MCCDQNVIGSARPHLEAVWFMLRSDFLQVQTHTVSWHRLFQLI